MFLLLALLMHQIRRSRNGKTKKERRKKSPVAVRPGRKKKKEKGNILVAHEILYSFSNKKKMNKQGSMAMNLDMGKTYDRLNWQIYFRNVFPTWVLLIVGQTRLWGVLRPPVFLYYLMGSQVSLLSKKNVLDKEILYLPMSLSFVRSILVNIFILWRIFQNLVLLLKSLKMVLRFQT